MSSLKYLMALDPGKLTGTVLLDYTNMDEDTPPAILYAEEPEQYQVCAWVESQLQFIKSYNQASDFGEPPDHPIHLDIVMEKFTITTETGKKKDVNYSLEIIGTVKYLAEKYGVKYSFQTPAEAMNFVDNDRIRAVGLWTVGGAGHKKDAMRHAIKYLVFQKGWRPKGLVNG